MSLDEEQQAQDREPLSVSRIARAASRRPALVGRTIWVAALVVLSANAGCVLVPPRPPTSPQSGRVAGDEEDEEDDDDGGIYGDHVDDETGVCMGPECEPTASDDDATDYPSGDDGSGQP